MEQAMTSSTAMITDRKAVLNSQRGKVPPSPRSVVHTLTPVLSQPVGRKEPGRPGDDLRVGLETADGGQYERHQKHDANADQQRVEDGRPDVLPDQFV